jgi:poly-gamma-glutamate synthesis protein (capsule biosynthesis protein)
VKLALAGDTMLGRGVAERLRSTPPRDLVSPEVVEAAHEADAFVLNLECCISERGEPWPAPGKPFFFRAPPRATEFLDHLGVGCVTLANNHALDFGYDALLDTLENLQTAGIATVGAGADLDAARALVALELNGFRLAVLGATDHPNDFAAQADHPGVALLELDWLTDAIAAAKTNADAVLVTPHWGPNMRAEPTEAMLTASKALEHAGATLVAGHSAHVFQGVARRTLYDLGDFLDDYRVDPLLRNDLGLLFLVELSSEGPRRLEALPLELDYCYTRVASGDDAAWIARRLRQLCGAVGTEVREEGRRLAIELG